MTQEWVLKTLFDLGFEEKEAEVYVHLAVEGSMTANKLSSATKIHKRQIYRILSKLQKTGIAKIKKSKVSEFSVITFDKVLDLKINANIQDANVLEEKKAIILDNFKHYCFTHAQSSDA